MREASVDAISGVLGKVELLKRGCLLDTVENKAMEVGTVTSKTIKAGVAASK